MRAEDWSFLVDGPLGRVRCSLPRGGGVPAPDLYRRVTARRGSAVILDVARFCPSDTFALPGIYALRPTLHLTQAGAEYGLAAVAGRFEGPPAWVRVTRGDGGYFEQIPEGGAE